MKRRGQNNDPANSASWSAAGNRKRLDRKRKLPAGWDFHSHGRRNNRPKQAGPAAWEFAVWGLVLGGLIGIALLLYLGDQPASSTVRSLLPPIDPSSVAQEPATDSPGGQQALAAADGADAAPSVRRSFTLCHSGGAQNCVVDGDTIWLDGTKIRIADIDAPETHPPRCPSEANLGTRATQRLLELVNAGAFIVMTIGDRDQDQYGRKLRILVRDGVSFGDQLVGEGLARTWTGRREPWCRSNREDCKAPSPAQTDCSPLGEEPPWSDQQPPLQRGIWRLSVGRPDPKGGVTGPVLGTRLACSAAQRVARL